MKTIQQHTSVYELCTTHPELISILMELGFKDLGNPLMLNSMGKIMTLPKASRAKGVAWDVIVSTLTAHGFELVE